MNFNIIRDDLVSVLQTIDTDTEYTTAAFWNNEEAIQVALTLLSKAASFRLGLSDAPDAPLFNPYKVPGPDAEKDSISFCFSSQVYIDLDQGKLSTQTNPSMVKGYIDNLPRVLLGGRRKVKTNIDFKCMTILIYSILCYYEPQITREGYEFEFLSPVNPLYKFISDIPRRVEKLVLPDVGYTARPAALELLQTGNLLAKKIDNLYPKAMFSDGWVKGNTFSLTNCTKNWLASNSENGQQLIYNKTYRLTLSARTFWDTLSTMTKDNYNSSDVIFSPYLNPEEQDLAKAEYGFIWSLHQKAEQVVVATEDTMGYAAINEDTSFYLSYIIDVEEKFSDRFFQKENVLSTMAFGSLSGVQELGMKGLEGFFTTSSLDEALDAARLPGRIGIKTSH